jgi:hypothetical protein
MMISSSSRFVATHLFRCLSWFLYFLYSMLSARIAYNTNLLILLLLSISGVLYKVNWNSLCGDGVCFSVYDLVQGLKQWTDLSKFDKGDFLLKFSGNSVSRHTNP